MLIFICGMGGTGKDSILKKILKIKYIEKLVCFTTREIRSKEREGVDYYFVSQEKFNEMLSSNSFLECREYKIIDRVVNYATQRYSDFNKIYVSCGSIDQFVNIKRENEDTTIGIFIKSSARDRINRMLKRAKEESQVIEACRRVYADERDFLDIKEQFHPDYEILNSDGKIDQVILEVEGIIRSLQK